MLSILAASLVSIALAADTTHAVDARSTFRQAARRFVGSQDLEVMRAALADMDRALATVEASAAGRAYVWSEVKRMRLAAANAHRRFDGEMRTRAPWLVPSMFPASEVRAPARQVAVLLAGM